VREPDGLALSSRNRYLSSAERRQALVLSRALDTVRQRVRAGRYSSQALIAEGRKLIGEEPEVRIDYFAVVNPDTLEDVSDVHRGALIAVAAWVGTTRLIDNLLLNPLQP
jgi:pantoate--beta-alanine ligase